MSRSYAPVPVPRGHVPALDGLRLVCCVAVVAGHSAWGTLSGRLASFGVDVFFALSGYLITTLLLRERARCGEVGLGAFYARRALRILPVYYAGLAAAFGLTWALGDAFTTPFRGPADGRFFTSTLSLYALFVGNWTAAPVPSSLDVMWSVCIEEQFYVLFPPLFARARRTLPVVLPAMLGLLVAWTCRAYLAAQRDPGLYRNTFAHADGLLLGALFAQLVLWIEDRVRAFFTRRAMVIEAGALTASAALLFLRGSSQSPLSYWAAYLASAICATALVGAIALGRGPIARVLAWRPLAWAGTLTYAGYVVHMYAVTAAFGITRRAALGLAETPVRIALALAMTLALAYVAHVAIERPFLRYKARYEARLRRVDAPLPTGG